MVQIFVSGQSNNKVGDLFNDRMKDLVHALGYETVSVNLHVPGRELDIRARHLLERRGAIVECKAQDDPIGGRAVNTFVGVLDAERSEGDMVGYYVSLSGFRESAIEQERLTGRQRCVLVGPDEIQDHLRLARILPSESETLLKLAPNLPTESSSLTARFDLVADEDSWLQVVFLLDGVRATHFALTYPSGEPLPQSAIDIVLARCLKLRELVSNVDAVAAEDPAQRTSAAATNYCRYLAAEFGVIRAEGLPANASTGTARPVQLESLYVPMRFAKVVDDAEDNTDIAIPASSNGRTISLGVQALADPSTEYRSLAEILEESQHVALLGPPGAGKSTIVKRLAMAYADPARRQAVEDGLPDLDLLPVVLRCREIVAPRLSVSDALNDLARWAEMPDQAVDLQAEVGARLDSGRILLLVDGLDEIADAQSRLRFTHQLRTFLAMYPLIRVVVTSRQAGFPLVAGAVAEFAQPYRLLELDPASIRQLTLAWYKEVDPASTSSGLAARVADGITQNSRLGRLAATPLLLTMLLLVQRWSGGQELPRKRSLLYERAVEVLLNTWNTEGHEPLNLDEAVPQLAYVAAEMMQGGVQRIAQPRLQQLLREAREALPEVLGYTKASPAEFLMSVELRSSLLMHSGYLPRANGGADNAYEFKHLIFQEYLTAVALLEGWCGSGELASLQALLAPRLSQPSWSEVLVLTITMAGRRGAKLVQWLLEEYEAALAESVKSHGEALDAADELEEPGLQSQPQVLIDLLEECLADEAHVDPLLAERVMKAVIQARAAESISNHRYRGILSSRFGQQFAEVTSQGLMSQMPRDFVQAAAAVFVHRYRSRPGSELVQIMIDGLAAGPAERRLVVGALCLLAYEYSTPRFGPDDRLAEGWPLGDLRAAATAVLPNILAMGRTTADDSELGLLLWCLSWVSNLLKLPSTYADPLLQQMLRAYAAQPANDELLHYAAWILRNNYRPGRAGSLVATPEELGALSARITRSPHKPETLGPFQPIGAQVLANYCGLISDEEVAPWVKPVRSLDPDSKESAISEG